MLDRSMGGELDGGKLVDRVVSVPVAEGESC